MGVWGLLTSLIGMGRAAQTFFELHAACPASPPAYSGGWEDSPSASTQPLFPPSLPAGEETQWFWRLFPK